MNLLVSACIAFFIVFPIYLIASAIASRPSKQKAEQEELEKLAIARGHVVTAKLVKIQSHSVRPASSFSNHDCMGIYKYTYNGKNYRYTFQADNPPGMLTLYFVDNPRKATVARALKKKGAPWPIIYAIIVAIVYMLMKIA
jgi:hypothetical protein